MTAIALTIAGSDSGGRAGIQADLKIFSVLGAYGASVLTVITAQNKRAVTAVHLLPPDIIRAQIEAVFDDLAVGAIKIGILGQPDLIRAVADSVCAGVLCRWWWMPVSGGCSSFRFDTAPEPATPGHRFIARSDLCAGDFVVELRDEAEAPCPATPPHAHRLKVEGFGPHGPFPAPRTARGPCLPLGPAFMARR